MSAHIEFGEIEHIKPKAKGKYPHLAYDWENLGFACPKCNNAKADEYNEKCIFIDPYSENPALHIFAAHTILFPKFGSERGEFTILKIGLNRPGYSPP